MSGQVHVPDEDENWENRLNIAATVADSVWDLVRHNNSSESDRYSSNRFDCLLLDGVRSVQFGNDLRSGLFRANDLTPIAGLASLDVVGLDWTVLAFFFRTPPLPFELGRK